MSPTIKTLQGQYAGFVSRFLAFFIDSIIIVAAIMIIGWVTNIILTFFGLGQIMTDILEGNNILGGFSRWVAAIGTLYFVAFFYFTLLWTITGGKSIGKALVGVRIVRFDGRPITFLRSIRRCIALWLAALPLFLGLLWVLGDDRRQGWHDKISYTCVIYDWPAVENEGAIESLVTRWQYVKQTRNRVAMTAKKEIKKL